jgi:small subunit ribosomal protein S8
MAEHKVVDVPASNMKRSITKILHEKGYILDYKFEETKNNQGNIKIALKYNFQTKSPAIKKLIRISKPGLRKYVDSTRLPRVINGLGIAIISTSKGVITDKEARNFNIGGEVICHVY